MAELKEVATGLRFPEGPVAMDDGSVVLVEIARGTVTRVSADGEAEVVAETGGGPNGAALGPDGKLYVCNNGASFDFVEREGLGLFPHQPPSAWEGGRIERVDLETGEVERIYEECDGRPLRGPNDLVFDEHGGFWFTDHGIREERVSDRTAAFYAKPDGSEIREVIFPLDEPNGIGLSPGGDRVYVAETVTGRVWFWPVTGPGEVEEVPGVLPHGGQLLAGLPELQGLDSLAVDSEGYVCVGTLVTGGITAISPDGSERHFTETGDILTTNICFGGEDLRTAYITCSAGGRLVSMEWPRPGLRLANQ
jgi:gluconolactonase